MVTFVHGICLIFIFKKLFLGNKSQTCTFLRKVKAGGWSMGLSGCNWSTVHVYFHKNSCFVCVTSLRQYSRAGAGIWEDNRQQVSRQPLQAEHHPWARLRESGHRWFLRWPWLHLLRVFWQAEEQQQQLFFLRWFSLRRYELVSASHLLRSKPGNTGSLFFSLCLLVAARRLRAASSRLPALPFLRLHGPAPGSVRGGREPLVPLVQTRQAGHRARTARKGLLQLQDGAGL